MNAKIQNLAEFIRVNRTSNKKFVVMLGAGASVGAKVPPMARLVKEVIDRYDHGGRGTDHERFDRVWKAVDRETRGNILKEFLDKEPSKGHRSLSRLIEKGYFDAVITFNYDDLLEQSLKELNIDHKLCVRGEHTDEVFAEYMLKDNGLPRVLKIHGSIRGANVFLASWREMRDYPNEIAEAFRQITDSELLVCGYSFGDFCVTRSFTERTDGGMIYCADPEGASLELKRLALARLADERIIDGDDGKFDEFFPALEQALSHERDVPVGEDVPVGNIPEHNPFKFIEGLYGDDCKLLIGRDEDVREIGDKVDSGNCQFINIYGDKKCGKSSFLRAGVMPLLREQEYKVIYLRCPSTQDDELVGMLSALPSLEVPIGELADTVGAMEAQQRERLVIVLDQFERAVKSILPDRGEDAFIDLYEQLYLTSKKIACLILASRDERTPYVINTPTYIIKLIERHRDDKYLVDALVELRRQKVDDVEKILTKLNHDAADCIPQDLRKKYAERASNGDEFTLAHAHSLCHLYVSEFMRKGEPPGDVEKRDVEGKLNLAINACDVMNLIDDLSLKEERILLRNLMKIVSDDSRGRIATHVRDSLTHLLTEPGYTGSAADVVMN